MPETNQLISSISEAPEPVSALMPAILLNPWVMRRDIRTFISLAGRHSGLHHCVEALDILYIF